MNIKMLDYWTSEPPIDLCDSQYCQIVTRKGVESGWYVRDLVKGKKKGWKEVYVLVLGVDEYDNEMWRWRKRICKPSNFNFQPRFPVRPSREMQLARQSKTERQRDRFKKMVRDEQGLYWDAHYNTWKRVDGDEIV